MPYVADFARLCEAVKGLDVEAPKAVTAILDTLAAMNTPVKAVNAGAELREAIKQAAKDGQALSVDQAHSLLGDLSRQPISAYVATEVQNLELPTSKLIQDHLRGDAGDELMANLAPVVDHAIRGIQRAGEFYTPDTTAAQLIDLGPEAVQAWRAAGEHAEVLDRVMNTVLRPLTNLELIYPELRRDVLGIYLNAVWIINPDRAYLLPEIGKIISQMTTDFTVPGGRWLKINSMAGLHLNSPRVANQILRAIHDVTDRENEERYGLKAQLAQYHGIDGNFEEVDEVDERPQRRRASVY